MSRLLFALLCSTMLTTGVSSTAIAQQPSPAGSKQANGEASNFWLVGGGAFGTSRGTCQTCEEQSPYRHAGSVLGNVGYRVNQRMDVGVEVFWMPVKTAAGHIRTTHLDAIAQFRPWSSQGFFIKGGAGMAFVRNWVDFTSNTPITSKALSVVIGAGWAFRPAERFGFQVFGAQHAAGLGDLQVGDTSVNDVMGNFWSVGAAVVIR